ncbi:MAG: SurA N-terminal domain-containing protein [bacterium]
MVKLILRYLLSAVFIIGLGFSFFANRLYAQEKIIAIVNSDVITQKDLDDFVNFTRMQLSEQYQGKELQEKTASLKSDLLNKLIEDRLILQEAKKSKIKIDEGKVSQRVAEIKKRYPSEVEFQQALSQQGLVQADVEARIREQILMYAIIETKVKSKVSINPPEVTDFYQKNPQLFIFTEQRDFASVSLEDEYKAREIFNKIKKGFCLEELANEYSFVVNRLDAVVQEQLKKDIAEALFKIKLGESAGPLKIEDKYYIFRLDKINPPRPKKLSEVQDKIYSFLSEKKMQEALIKWLSETKSNSYIKIIQD